MNIIERVKNSYRTAGVKEIIRKITFKLIYNINNRKTIKCAKKMELKFGLNEIQRDKKIIVSLTSFPPRFPNIGLCLKSLLCQDTKPDRIIVYFSNDTNESDLTEEMREYQKYGIEYRFNKQYNLKPHDKYIHAMKEFPDDIVVTADDDIVYPHDWLTSLISTYERYPNCICARRVHLMTFDENGDLRKYNHFIDQCRKITTPSRQLLATGCGGALYPPHLLIEETFNIDNIIKLSLDADDIWLKCMEILSDVKVVWVKNWEVEPATTVRESPSALSSSNVGESKNDIILRNVMKEYNIKDSSFR